MLHRVGGLVHAEEVGKYDARRDEPAGIDDAESGTGKVSIKILGFVAAGADELGANVDRVSVFENGHVRHPDGCVGNNSVPGGVSTRKYVHVAMMVVVPISGNPGRAAKSIRRRFGDRLVLGTDDRHDDVREPQVSSVCPT